ncbi:MAG: repressor LexA [Acidocella sp. 20-57-95]|nr:MAG: repressor LexA [Acidocella sp. 20-57-95]OYV61769.1 MAG: repressor LexA [Acidocella sp. 21-58-7]HQT65483.1 transcriptional repressor LexA [Acidocella sp.]HQU03444.1 transcriptional repressor LexA [Acidocella sp.]
MLTSKQHELLVFIDQHLRKTGCSPSFEEMKDALDLRSKSGIHRLITALEERGFLRRHKHRARALEVVRLSEDLTPPEREIPRFAPNVIHGNFPGKFKAPKAANESALGNLGEAGSITLPLYGKIAAGLPIEALQDDHAAEIEVPVNLLGSGDHFALEVEGESMIEAGILNGDTVIIRRGETAENGQIIVALVDENEVTLKRLRRRGNSIALEPANVRFETKILPADRVKIQGRLVALLRKY